MRDYIIAVDNSNQLQHWGVKGMHWYERKYQNYDGSLTDLGREHYGVGAARVDKLMTKAAKKRAKAQKMIEKADTKLFKGYKTKKGGLLRKANPKKGEKLTGKGLKMHTKANRLIKEADRLEKKANKILKNLNEGEVKPSDLDPKTLAIGRKYAMNIVDNYSDEVNSILESFRKTEYPEEWSIENMNYVNNSKKITGVPGQKWGPRKYSYDNMAEKITDATLNGASKKELEALIKESSEEIKKRKRR